MSQVAGITDIQTDPAALKCTFKVTDPELDYQAVLAKLAETNTHLADFKIETPTTDE